ncbi:MAG: hydroxyacylglutathione hydrolase [Frankiales bacterium]|nr:hydroxyacylglutathione hydrolase [Frankiales bacterium]
MSEPRPAIAPCPEASRPSATPGAAVALAEGLWQVAGPGITHPWDAAAYLVTGAHAALVDCGTGLAPDQLDTVLLSCGVLPHQLSAVLATHGHFDHVGDGARLSSLGVPVLVHAGDAEAVRSADPVRTCAESLYGTPFAAFEPDAMADGDQLNLQGARLHVIHTPGHTPGSVSVVAQVGGLRVLLAGDTLWGGFSAAIGSDEQAWRESLDLLAALDVDALSFGHGISRLLGDPQGRIAEARQRFATYFDPWFKPPKQSFDY